MLAAMPLDEYQRLVPLLQPVELKLGESLAESEEKMRQVYFPTDAIVSLLCVMDDGGSTAITVVGDEGVGRRSYRRAAASLHCRQRHASRGVVRRFTSRGDRGGAYLGITTYQYPYQHRTDY